MKREKLYMLSAATLSLITGLGLYGIGVQAMTSTYTQLQKQQDTVTQITADLSETDLNATYDEANASQITLTETEASVSGEGVSYEAGVVTISTSGTYMVSGTSSQIQLKVTAPDDALVQIVLNGVTMNHESAPVIYVESADKVILTSADGTTNQLSDGTKRADESLDATIFSNDDLTLNGTGSLIVTGNYANAIESNDDLNIVGQGMYQFKAVNHGLNANDEIKLVEATISIEAGKDGIHVNNDEDTSLGNIYLNPTSLTIAATDDGVDASNQLVIGGGIVTVTQSTEGLEAKLIHLIDGTVQITASDDGLNASAGSSNETGQSQMEHGPMSEFDESLQLIIDGGTLTIDAEGDGIDSNGSLTINGGTIYVAGPSQAGNGAIDAELAIINGGNIIALDTGDMSQGFGNGSTQASVSTAISGQVGAVITLSDSEGNELLSYTAPKAFQHLICSVEGMVEGETYTLSVDGQTSSLTASATTEGNQMMMGIPPMQNNQQPNGQMPPNKR